MRFQPPLPVFVGLRLVAGLRDHEDRGEPLRRRATLRGDAGGVHVEQRAAGPFERLQRPLGGR